MRTSPDPSSRLILELFDEATQQWRQIGELKPGDPPASLSDNNDDGTRNVYVIECAADGSGSTVYRSKAGVDIANEKIRQVFTADLEVHKSRLELTKGQSHEMEIKTDRSPQKIRIRLRQV